MLSELIETLEQTIQDLSEKTREACRMGKLAEAVDYANALHEACCGYRDLTVDDE